MSKITYLNAGGFQIYLFENGLVNLNNYLNKSTVNWKYIFIPRRIVTFPILFKYIVENQSTGSYYTRIFFYETRNNPLELLIYVKDYRSIYILSSNIPIHRLLKRIIANPRFSETVIFLAEIENDIENMLVKYTSLIKLINKLFPELTRIVYSRGAGRVLLIEFVEKETTFNLTVCVSQKGVFFKTTTEELSIDVKDIEHCFPQ